MRILKGSGRRLLCINLLCNRFKLLRGINSQIKSNLSFFNQRNVSSSVKVKEMFHDNEHVRVNLIHLFNN